MSYNLQFCHQQLSCWVGRQALQMKEHDQFAALLDHRRQKTADRETLPPDPTQHPK